METAATGSDVYSDSSDGVTSKPVSYKDFVMLWSHLLNPSKIKVCMCIIVLLSVSSLPIGIGESL